MWITWLFLASFLNTCSVSLLNIDQSISMKNKWGEVAMYDMHLKGIPDNVPAESVATKVTMTEYYQIPNRTK